MFWTGKSSSNDVDQLLLTVEELLEWISAAEEVSEDVERVSEDEVHPGIHAAKRITLEHKNQMNEDTDWVPIVGSTK